MTTPNEYCTQKAANSGSSFYYSFRFLPPQQRQAIIAVYAFCREVDDVVDDYSDLDVAQKKLAWWYEELQRLYQGKPQHPVTQALAEALTHYNLEKTHFEQLLQGMQMDLTFQGYETFEDLKVYCHCAASTVGLLAAEIFGYTDPKTLEYARKLGIAFQLVNIIRDVGEDTLRNRLYLPENELERFNVKTRDIFEKKQSEAFNELMAFQVSRAKQYYQEALDILPASDRFYQRSGLIMAKIYFTLLDEIIHSNYAVLKQRISLTPIRKLWIAWKTARAETKRYKPLASPL